MQQRPHNNPDPKSNDTVKEALRNEYIARINRVIDYIEANLDQDLTLSVLAEVAHFSRFHFHRLFRAIVGDTLNRFIQRIRVEKAASRLINNPGETITEIALDCGFSGSAAFSRAFRETFDTTPSQWRTHAMNSDGENFRSKSKIRQTVRKIRQDMGASSAYIDPVTNNLTWRITMTGKDPIHVEVKEMSELTVAYVRHIGPYKGDADLFENLFQKLMTWAGPRGLLRFPDTLMLAVYHDNPDITDEEKLRVSVCITIPADTKVDGEIGKMTIPDGRYAFARFELTESDQYEDAWNTIMGRWLPESGYQPDNRVCFEIYRNNPKEHPEGIHIVDICVPVKPL